MTRSSPGVRRIAAILNFIADHPGQAFALTDLVRALKLSRATCHALLTGLVEVGYLYRTGDKGYVLGPALAAIGRTATAHVAPLQVAQPEMRELADEFGLICTAYVLEGDSAVVRERAAAAAHVGYLGPLGTRLKLRPHSGAVFFAWSPEAEARKWLDGQEPPLPPVQRAGLLAGMAFAQAQGFIAIVREPGQGPAEPLLDVARGDMSFALLGAVAEDESYSLASLVVPVFDQRGKVAFAIGLAGFAGAYDGREVRRIAERLVGAGERVTRFIGGKAPVEPSAGKLAA